MMETARELRPGALSGEELEALALAARDGDARAFDGLVRGVGGRLLAFASRVLGNRALAEEAVQEALVRIYRFLPRYEPKNFLAWSFTVTHRTCMDVAKRERRSAGAEPLPPEGGVVEDPADAIDVRASVDAALARLPGHLRTTFLLVQQGLSYDDAAQVLEIPIGTVRSRVHEARRLLRAALAETLQGGKES